MPRPLNEIIAHIRAVAANPAVSTTLIQTEDLEALCAAAELDREKMIEAILTAHTDKAMQRMPWVDRSEVVAENETYRPYAAADVDAIIAVLRPRGDGGTWTMKSNETPEEQAAVASVADAQQDALNRLRRACERGTGCHLTADMVHALSLTAIGSVWMEDDPRSR